MAVIEARIAPQRLAGTRAARLIERNIMVYRRTWIVIVSGFFEPVFYLLAIGFGIGGLVGDVLLPNGQTIPYAVFVAPGLLASSAMNGAIYDSTFNIFFKLRYAKTYDAMLSTPIDVPDVAVGEIAWALIRGTLYAIGFLIAMAILGLIESPLVILTIPGSMLIGFAFAAVGMAATTWVRRWTDFDWIFVVTLPLFLFSATFYPLDVYPEPLRTFVALTPLTQSVVLLRSLSLGSIGPELLVPVIYLTLMGLAGLWVVNRRLGKLLLK
jgi:lipooligosaccharide transport system permease protein